jgi:hypothetical protein
MKVDVPTFSEDAFLARYIKPEYRQGSRRAKVTAFMEDQDATQNGLSVNSIEVESEGEIAEVYAKAFDEERPVALCVHTVADYNSAADQAGTGIRRNEASGAWEHDDCGSVVRSYKHDPKDKTANKLANKSHCLAVFTTSFDALAALKFARRMAYKETYDLF